MCGAESIWEFSVVLLNFTVNIVFKRKKILVNFENIIPLKTLASTVAVQELAIGVTGFPRSN